MFSISSPAVLAKRLTQGAALATFAVAGMAHADGLATLDQYLKSTKSGVASFTQTVTNTNKPGAAKTSHGQFAFKRPQQQFRFDYTKPFSQTIVADGKTLWMYDADLNQVTQRSQSAALSTTPAALVASSNNIQALKKQFKLENAPAKDTLEWVKAVPLKADTQIKDVMIGFDGKQLRRLEILDSFGQRSVMEFGPFAAVSAKTSFRFKAPAGADIIRN
ncbi:MAG: outer membrane lipoprotein chaperone LolA [Brachymonas sp.]|nr:outer membrane lipoprotein chaperone LolA [Brachymonas sp.]